ncbi:hypothetical protein GOC21_17655 [Sinorhizobium meliloti]|nr:hypothetical protein [Sinorhizobium meliloti]
MDRRVRVVEPPTPIVTVDEVVNHLVEVPTEDRSYVESLVLAATAWIDGPSGWLGRTLGVQTLEYTLDGFEVEDCSDVILLPFEPLIDITSVVYVDDSGATVTMPPEDYVLTLGGARPASDGVWPATDDVPGAVKIRYRAGYGKPDPGDPAKLVNDAPASIKVAIMMLVAQWYRYRETVAVGASVASLPFAVEALLSPYRVYR